MKRNGEEGWTSIEVMAALLICLLSLGAIAGVAMAAIKAGGGLAKILVRNQASANTVSDEIITLYRR
jgi:hypothetical protein